MQYKLYTTAKSAWRAMIRSIVNAKSYVYIEMYAFVNDTPEEHDFLKILSKKAKQGVEVVLVLDSVGSMDLKNSEIRELKSLGVEIRFFSKWLRRTHRKILVVDDRLAYLGGVNFHKKSLDWVDVQIKMTSKPLIRNILRSFSYTYKMSGGDKKHILDKGKTSVFKTLRAQFLEHLPGKNIYSLEAYYQSKLISANKSITMVTPYFLPPRWLVALLDNAVSRGVKVDIIIPLKTDYIMLNRINYAYISEMKDMGISFYAQKQMNHAKIFIIDEKEALIGSQNLDILSFRVNVESGVFINDKQVVGELLGTIDKWKNDSTDFLLGDRHVNFLDRLIVFFIKFFYTII